MIHRLWKTLHGTFICWWLCKLTWTAWNYNSQSWARDAPKSGFKLPTTIWLLRSIAAFCSVDPQLHLYFPGSSWCHFCSVFSSRVFQLNSHGQPRAMTTVWIGVGGRSSGISSDQQLKGRYLTPGTGLSIKHPMASEGSIAPPTQRNYFTHTNTHTDTPPQGLNNSC